MNWCPFLFVQGMEEMKVFINVWLMRGFVIKWDWSSTAVLENAMKSALVWVFHSSRPFMILLMLQWSSTRYTSFIFTINPLKTRSIRVGSTRNLEIEEKSLQYKATFLKYAAQILLRQLLKLLVGGMERISREIIKSKKLVEWNS